MDYIEIWLPIFILALAFFYKLSIDRDVNVPNLIQSICELPVDIIFYGSIYNIGTERPS